MAAQTGRPRSLKTLTQKLAIRSVSSELDRRSRALEKAIADTNAQLRALGDAQQVLSTQIEANHDYVTRVHDHLGNIEGAHNRLVAMHAATASRLDESGPEQVRMQKELEAIVGEFVNLRQAVARIDAIVEQRT
jgi:ABC-type transporter Mla subunit MlaD